MLWLWLAAAMIAATLYIPALHGRFLFDDNALPFLQGIRDAALGAWISGVRPILMFTYWLNYTISGWDPYGYHLLNLLIHVTNACLVFVLLFRLLGLAGWPDRKRSTAAILGAVVFLIHPLATESVSYIAGRSESLAALFALAAYVIFLDGYAAPITWRRSLAVLGLLALAFATKENAVALAGVLLLTDLYWPEAFSWEGVRRNRRIYILMLPGIPAAFLWVLRVLADAQTAGFSLNGVTWYQYAFTQARAVLAYVRLAALPFGQSVDHDFPVSQTIGSYGAIYCVLLLVALVVSALHYRKRYPLACFGFLLFLVLLAPTSSIVPIADPMVERRLYLPIVGLILIGCQVAGGAHWSRATVSLVASVIVLFSALCYHRNQLWGRPERIWVSAAQKSTRKGRPYLGVAVSMIAANRCNDAVPFLERGEALMPRDFDVQVAWGKISECQGKREDALLHLERAATLMPTSSVYQLIGLLYGEMGRQQDAGNALRKAAALGPRDPAAHSALGLWHESVGDVFEAEREYRKALALDGYNAEAQAGLERIREATAASRTPPTF